MFVRSEPRMTASVVDRVTYDVVPFSAPTAEALDVDGGLYEWMKIFTPRGRSGWVLTKYVWEPGLPVVCVEKEGDDWRLSSVTAD